MVPEISLQGQTDRQTDKLITILCNRSRRQSNQNTNKEETKAWLCHLALRPAGKRCRPILIAPELDDDDDDDDVVWRRRRLLLLLLLLLLFNGHFSTWTWVIQFLESSCSGRELLRITGMVFFLLRATCPSCYPVISVKALKGAQCTNNNKLSGLIHSSSTTRVLVEGGLLPLHWLTVSHTSEYVWCGVDWRFIS